MLRWTYSFFYVKIPDASTRTWGLDLIRCIAVLDIVKIHMWQMFYCWYYDVSIPNVWPINGVQLFFVLSGFLIGGIIIRQTEGRGWHPANMFRFMCRRWFRTLPNYYAVLIANILLQYFLYGPSGLKNFSFHFFTFTYNFMSTGPAFFMEAWSISIEEWFYFLYAVMAALLYAVFSHRKYIKPISLSIALVIILVPTLLRFTHYYRATPSLNGTVAFRIDGIGYGVAGAWFYYYYPDLWKRLKWFLLGAGLLLMFFVHLPDGKWHDVFIMSLLSMGYTLCLPLFSSLKKSPPLVGYSVQVISQLSYSMYLLNLGIAGSISLWLFPVIKASNIFWVTAFYIALLWVLTLVFYKFIERPFMELRNRYYP